MTAIDRWDGWEDWLRVQVRFPDGQVAHTDAYYSPDSNLMVLREEGGTKLYFIDGNTYLWNGQPLTVEGID